MIKGEGYLAAQAIADRLSEIEGLNVTPYMRDLSQGIDASSNSLEGSIGVSAVEATSTMARTGAQEITWDLDISVPSGFSSAAGGAEDRAEAKILDLASYDPDCSVYGKVRGYVFKFVGVDEEVSEFTVHIDAGISRGFRITDNGSVSEHVLSCQLRARI